METDRYKYSASVFIRLLLKKCDYVPLFKKQKNVGWTKLETLLSSFCPYPLFQKNVLKFAKMEQNSVRYK